ncbi:MAG: hypothetical protein M3R38_17870 [Actinomycetota bacterium]|nr:hypothetical protein [Actinomycetota bacterium]
MRKGPAVFEDHPLRRAANEYVRECLEYGHSLSRGLRRLHDVKSGRVVARLPLGANTVGLEKFEWGGKKRAASPYPERSPSAEEALASSIASFLAQGEGRVCVFENYLARRTDPWIARAKSRTLFFGDEVYHVVAGEHTGRDEVETAIREAKSPSIFVGTLSRLPLGYRLDAAGSELSEDLMRVLAEGAEEIVVGAYDGEGYLIWRKS